MFLKLFINSALLPAILEFSLFVINDVVLKLFQAERPLAVFLYEKLKTLFSIMKQFVQGIT